MGVGLGRAVVGEAEERARLGLGGGEPFYVPFLAVDGHLMCVWCVLCGARRDARGKI